jgi:hypothetical protein
MLWDGVRTGKEMLSRAPSTLIHVPHFGDAPLGREALEQLAAPVLERTVTATRAAIADSGLPAARIAGVFLVGGGSRLPLVSTLLHRSLRIFPTTMERPEFVVAEGSLLAPPLPAAPVMPPPTFAPPPFTPAAPPFPLAAPPPLPLAAPPVDATPVDAEPIDAEPVDAERIDTTSRNTTPGSTTAGDTAAVGTAAPPVEPAAAGLPRAQVARAKARPAKAGPPQTRRPRVIRPKVHRPSLAPAAKAAPSGRSVPRSPRVRRAVAAGLAMVVLLVLAAAGLLGVVRPWSDPHQGGGASPAPRYTGPLSGAGGAAVFSPDGRYLATYVASGVMLWDTRTGQPTRPLSQRAMTSAPSPSGGAVSTAPSQDAATLNPERLTFSGDGTRLAIGSIVVNVQTGTTIVRISDSGYDDALSPDGTVLAVASGYANEGVRLHEVSTGALTRSITNEYASSVAYSPDGVLLAAAVATNHGAPDAARRVRLWRPATGGLVRTIDNAHHPVFSGDGTVLATVTEDGMVQLWRVATGGLINTFGRVVDSPTLSRDGRVLAAVSLDKAPPVVWSVPHPDQPRVIGGDPAYAVAFSPDGHTLAVVTGSGVRLWAIAG